MWNLLYENDKLLHTLQINSRFLVNRCGINKAGKWMGSFACTLYFFQFSQVYNIESMLFSSQPKRPNQLAKSDVVYVKRKGCLTCLKLDNEGRSQWRNCKKKLAGIRHGRVMWPWFSKKFVKEYCRSYIYIFIENTTWYN